jgi:hypothetical protein
MAGVFVFEGSATPPNQKCHEDTTAQSFTKEKITLTSNPLLLTTDYLLHP